MGRRFARGGGVIAANYKGRRMTNIPTDLLRTFVSVVELRSFTRAAKAQGMTQPAVSAQIRRLQSLLGVELLDKRAPGVSLTARGERVLDSARRMLSVNDHIVQIAGCDSTAQLVRVGVPGDCMGDELARMLAASRTRWPNLRFTVEGGGQGRLLQCLTRDEIDIALTLVINEPQDTAHHYWTEELAWVRGKSTTLDPDAAVPLVAYKDVCVCYRVGAAALAKTGRAAELVFRATSSKALRTAVATGLGIMIVPRRRIPAELTAWDDGPLPPLPPVFCGIFVRESANNETLHQLAEQFAMTLRPQAVAGERITFVSPRILLPAAAPPPI